MPELRLQLLPSMISPHKNEFADFVCSLYQIPSRDSSKIVPAMNKPAVLATAGLILIIQNMTHLLLVSQSSLV